MHSYSIKMALPVIKNDSVVNLKTLKMFNVYLGIYESKIALK
jgi:hypothetical protein